MPSARAQHRTRVGRVTDLARAERLGLADTLDRVGPDAPTLCAGWTATDLALHLVLRDRFDPALLATDGGPFRGMFARRRRIVLRRHGYAGLVRLFRAGPPRLSPYSLRWLDSKANGVEFFIHHEDVLRAQSTWSPRPLTAEHDHELLRALRYLGRRLARHSAAGVEVATPDGQTVTVRRGTPAATLVGRPGELLLYLAGRRGVADVTIAGDPAAREALAHAKLGF
jgi:uncharacterized protein (TIGR03085 family)